MRRVFVILLLALTACRGKVIKTGVRVDVSNKSNAEIVRLKVTATSSVGSTDLLLPATPQSTPIEFPTSFSLSVPVGMTGEVEIVILGRDSAEATVAHGTASATLQPDTYVSTPIELNAVAIGGSGGSGGTSGTGGTGGDTGSGGTTSMGGTLSTGGSGDRGGAGGTGGTSSSGASNGSGGMTGSSGGASTTGTAVNTTTGGTTSAGGATGTGGASGTGGSTSPSCSPACKPDEDCIKGVCESFQAGGMTCSESQTCSTTARCCDGSQQSCDGTRLPSGDGTNDGEFVVSKDGLTVTDTITGLVWQRDGSTQRTWDEAKAFCASLTLGGISGWRLPAVMELSTIVDFTKSSGGSIASIDPTAFPGTRTFPYWTSSPCAGSSSSTAWVVVFSNGGVGFIIVSGSYWVRCVH